nr:ABC transporter ATP-binding protein [Saccharopolyspora sp. HNM0983]
MQVEDVTIDLAGQRVVDGVGFALPPGSRHGMIGESGSGKSVTGLSLLGLLPPDARVRGSIRVRGREMLGRAASEWARLRGDAVAMVFQDAVSGLNPLVRIERQLSEPLRHRGGASAAEARTEAAALLSRVGFADPHRAARSYPPQLSGGQRQRVAIAMALACRPDVLIADEPTTSLDVTVQAGILQLLAEVTGGQDGPALLLISHDLPVVAQLCSEVTVLHDGSVIEHGPVHEVVRSPQHPRTAELVDSARTLDDGLPHAHRRVAS